MKKILGRMEFGNPILRQAAQPLTKQQVTSDKILSLINNMRYTLKSKKLGVGLAAPQIGQNLALAVIVIQPTKHRPKVEPFEQVVINPRIIRTIGSKKPMWEGCLSAGTEGLFAQVPRYNQVEAEYLDDKGRAHKRIFKDLPAQVLQHEIDHLNGILFVDLVKDTNSYMTQKEYKKRVVARHRRRAR